MGLVRDLKGAWWEPKKEKRKGTQVQAWASYETELRTSSMVLVPGPNAARPSSARSTLCTVATSRAFSLRPHNVNPLHNCCVYVASVVTGGSEYQTNAHRRIISTPDSS